MGGKKVTGTSRLIPLGSRGREILFLLEIMNEKSEKIDWLIWGSCDHPEPITDQDDRVLGLASLSHMLPAVACEGRKAGPVVVLWIKFFSTRKLSVIRGRDKNDWYQRHLYLARQADPVGPDS